MQTALLRNSTGACLLKRLKLVNHRSKQYQASQWCYLSNVRTVQRPLRFRFFPTTATKTILPTVSQWKDSGNTDMTERSERVSEIQKETYDSPAHVSKSLQSLEGRMPQFLFNSAAAGMAAALVYCNVHVPEAALSMEVFDQILRNIPLAATCAMMGDAVAQGVDQRHRGVAEVKVDWNRLLSAGAVAGLLQGGGTTIWLCNLNMLMPGSMVGFDSLSKFGALMGKVIVDSYIWGTLTNTFNIILRRLCARDSLGHAVSQWKRNIVNVTVSEFKFWPGWGAMVYAYVPVTEQVNAFAIGGFIWSVYLSWVANSVPQDKLDVSINRRYSRYGCPVGLKLQKHPRYTPAAVSLLSSQGGSTLPPQVKNTILAQRMSMQLLRNDKHALPVPSTGLPRRRGTGPLKL
ncbi:hypothetical protein GUITHDRAFT_122660 [Guillardia theta CCMP2712]|uniref:Uncharacterized protein n=2 Tax=Guillardia theta TaxID=55529 RepID=L1I4D3_GUITC|nr:hypothetical protein GUITHDRAFT_122660 [Guillardia theta CCMP2712]EKX31133.1 hypothetical protein GUITHDRAFT_122660 [Guillardia theta CCMP2712]|mmetsp:Transcript_49896/g.156190  ORF Transcript_49896/g.156190 Transcript_49896/m.156190 type:complete len:403 (+) Transcript_49896:518-1726(+)|eukprot:XP_005818113.1 hypothetical protein GUITHDRAFT_122660 [Guillardia theta CCMP2712]